MGIRTQNLLTKWHRLLNLPRQPSQAWHRARLHEELHERRSATAPLHRLSETADVLFTLSRARHDGFPLYRLPAFGVGVYVYMVLKFTLRWGFYRVAARMCRRGPARMCRRGDFDVREVVNPGKDGKLDEVAGRHGIDKERLRRVGRWLRCIWPLLH